MPMVFIQLLEHPCKSPRNRMKLLGSNAEVIQYLFLKNNHMKLDPKLLEDTFIKRNKAIVKLIAYPFISRNDGD